MAMVVVMVVVSVLVVVVRMVGVKGVVVVLGGGRERFWVLDFGDDSKPKQTTPKHNMPVGPT